MRPEDFNALARCEGRVEGRSITLTAPTPEHAEVVRQRYAPYLANMGGYAVEVRP
jgi:hypothetical protein